MSCAFSNLNHCAIATWLLVLLSPSANSSVHAQVEYRQRVWTRQNGLPSNTIQAILQTQDGFLWIGTRNGLARFDGLSFSVFNRKNTPAFHGDECTALAEDLSGALWIGTTKGLTRYRDGVFTTFTTADGLWDDFISGLCATTVGDVWIGTARGPVRFHNDKFIQFPPRGEVVYAQDRTTRALYEDRNGNLWIGSTSGLQRWDKQTASLEDVDFTSLPAASGFVKALAEDAIGHLWLRGNYLWKYGDDSWNGSAAREELSQHNITCLFSDRAGIVWLATKNWGIVQCRDGKLIRVAERLSLPDNQVLCLSEDREGSLWIGTETGGLVQWLPGRFSTLTTRQGLAHDNVWALSQRHDGSVWIGTDNGLSQILDSISIHSPAESPSAKGSIEWPLSSSPPRRSNPSPRIESYSVENGLADRAVQALLEDRSGTLWIGTGNGLDYLRNGEFGHHRFSGNEIHNTIRAVLEDRAGVLWVASQVGLHSRRDGQWTSYTATNGLLNIDIRALLEDEVGNLWIGTAGGGLSCLPGGRAGPPNDHAMVDQNSTFITFTAKDGLSDNFITALHTEKGGVLWVGTKRGLNRLSFGGAPRPANTSRPGDLRRSALATLPPIPVIQSVTTQQGLFDNTINHILEDDLGHLWIGCPRGIFRVRKKDLHAVVDGQSPTVECIAYNESDGLFSSETNGGKSQPSALKTRDGRLWFATTKGVVIIDPRDAVPTETPPPVYIDQIRANGEILAAHGESKMENGELAILQSTDKTSLLPAIRSSQSRTQFPAGGAQSLEILFTAPTLTSPENVVFRYRLEGYNQDWHEAGHERVAHYTNLRPGAYRFHVNARNHHGVWNKTGASFAFLVTPHVWETWWFRSLCGLSALTVFGSVLWQFHRFHTLRRAQALASERERIAQDMHDELGSQLSQIGFVTAAPGFASEHAAAELAQRAMRTLDDIVWATQPEKDRLDHFASYFSQWAFEYLTKMGIAAHLEIPDQLPPWPMSARTRHNLLLAAKEAMTNIVKHAQAGQVVLRLTVNHQSFTLDIRDNGNGTVATAAPRFRPDPHTGPDPSRMVRTHPPGTHSSPKPPSASQAFMGGNATGDPPIVSPFPSERRNGLANMRARIESAGGCLELQAVPGQGTTVRFHIPKKGL